jgi:hypothetical protein
VNEDAVSFNIQGASALHTYLVTVDLQSFAEKAALACWTNAFYTNHLFLLPFGITRNKKNRMLFSPDPDNI